jgi:hypothetical protein
MPDTLLQKNMEHGTKNEINAVATLVERVMPSYFPNIICHEEGCKALVGTISPVLVASPDGSGRTDENSETRFAFELVPS